MKKTIMAVFFVMTSQLSFAQVANDSDGLYDSTTLVDTNNNSTSASTVNSTSTNTNTNNNVNTTTVDSTSTNTNTNTNVNTNNNINSGEQTFNNNNVNTNTSTTTSTNTNNNTNTSTSTSTNTNTNNNVNTNSNTSTSDNTNRNIQSGTVTNNNNNKIDQTIKSPPPTAIAPAMMSGGNNDLCTVGSSGAVQTQILGVSSGGVLRDMNCERLKNAKTLYDMGMKVAAVATLCQDRRVFDAMWHAGTPCPFDGMIGEAAKKAWTEWPDRIPKKEEEKTDDFYKKTGFGAMLGLILLLAL